MMTGHLYRYTELPYLLYMLKNKAMTLLPYESWEDKNDVHFLREYSFQRRVKAFALCFTQADETFHHWKLFSNNSSGVRITFNKDEVTQWAAGFEGLRLKDVEYLTLNSIRNQAPEIERWPFVKRYPYQDEQEVRLFFESCGHEGPVADFKFDLQMIKRVTLSPWLPDTVRKEMREVIQAAAKATRIQVSKTTLISNDEWKRVTQPKMDR